MRNKTIALFLSVIATPAFAQSIVGTWDCTNWNGFRYTMILNADNTVTAGTAAGALSGRYALRGNTLVCSFAGLPNPSTNVITRRDQNSFESYPAGDLSKRETCRRVADVPTSCTVKGKCLKGDCANGTGMLLDSDGDRTECAFQNCECKNGRVITTFKDGTVTEMEYRNGKWGGHVRFVYPDGRRTEGEMEYGDATHPTGHFTYTYPNGIILEVDVRRGELNGHGVLTWANGAKYVGEFQNGKFQGQGTLTYANGDRFTGQFNGGRSDEPLASAQGVMIYATGNRYEGAFEHGVFSGQGTYVWKDGTKYVGIWRNGQRHGQGIEYNSDGTVKAQGEFVDDQPPAAAKGQ